jgi:vitamin B12 transporter
VSIGKATTQGVEVTLEYRPFRTVKLTRQYTYLDAKDTATGSQLLRRPRQRLANTVTLQSGPWEGTLTYELVGAREDVDATTFLRKSMPAYHLFHLTGAYRLFEKTQLTLRVDNLLNTKYQVIDGYATAGFSVFGGVRQEL